MQREDYKFGLGYHPTPKEIVNARQEAQARKTTARRGHPKNYNVRPHPLTRNGHFLREGDNFTFYGLSEPGYIKDKGLLVLRLEIFNDCHLLEENMFTAEKKNSPQKIGWI